MNEFPSQSSSNDARPAFILRELVGGARRPANPRPEQVSGRAQSMDMAHTALEHTVSLPQALQYPNTSA